MNMPSNLKFTEDHEWVVIEGDIAIVGVTAYAADQLGDIVFVDVATVGETLDGGEIYGSIEAVKTVSDLFLPIGGEIIEFNEEVEANPAIINEDPYGAGWIIKIKPTDPAEMDNLLSHEEYLKITE
ncbi:MAG TPA: glycine cleavage system protein GcvH [Bacteroidales bacterium]|nr:glycine cleavage system protein GcvH [Bacteroidales bacterium]HOH22429.1 glycine cleavage system protein GcvH [Bacteroidales bacterium]HPB56916.1 glycine cleavage system protein GcvH [Bacteroidales bacterium]HPZ03580.1 glycine cleavage system protein GcvH [Bacteroidales bacterium]HQB74962.1 glycine cleavage system protein GcvH [Bacteroidales bacterium]